jgi:hypothetical protein
LLPIESDLVMEPWLAPVFLLAPHRSGGTLLARLVNAHPGVVVWGEHAGIMNKLAEINKLISLSGVMEKRLADRGIEEFLQRKQEDFEFSPWINPVLGEKFREFARAFILQSFTLGLTPKQRWGTKEIRYHSPVVAAFLAAMFPASQFLILHRDPVEVCVSSVMAEWSLGHLALVNAGRSEAEAACVVADCAYALAVIEWGMERIRAAFPDRSLVIDYTDLAPSREDMVGEIFGFLRLPLDSATLSSTARVLNVRSGATPSDRRCGAITPAFVRAMAPQAVAEAHAQVARHGPDYGRLRSNKGVGRYGFLMGDHFAWRENLTSLF